MAKGGVVLFICVGNTCRSQMAEALFNHYAPKVWKAISAGTEPGREVHPLALKALKEAGIDHSQGKPKPLTSDMIARASRVIAVCTEAEACPVVPPGKKMEHWGIDDPVQHPDLATYGQTRDIIKEKVLQLIQELKDES